MLKRFLSRLDQKYLKICVYAAVTVLLTGIAAVLLSGTGPIYRRDHLVSSPAGGKPV